MVASRRARTRLDCVRAYEEHACEVNLMLVASRRRNFFCDRNDILKVPMMSDTKGDQPTETTTPLTESGIRVMIQEELRKALQHLTGPLPTPPALPASDPATVPSTSPLPGPSGKPVRYMYAYLVYGEGPA